MRRVKWVFKAALAMVLAIQLSGCGAILYPERRGQKSGNIDAGVAVMDGVLLIFFIIPGVIAYVVDFTTGAIYLPGGKRSDSDALRVVKLDPSQLTEEKIREVVAREAGVPLATLAGNKPQVRTLNDRGEILTTLTAAAY